MSTCDCGKKTTNGGQCDFACKECEPALVFESSSSSRVVLEPVVLATKAAGAVTTEVFFTDIWQ